MLATGYARKRDLRGRKSKCPRTSPRPSPRLNPRKISQPIPRLSPRLNPQASVGSSVRTTKRVNPQTRLEACTSQDRNRMNTRANSTPRKISSINSAFGRLTIRQPNYLVSSNELDSVSDDKCETVDISDASEFISEFDEAIKQLEKLEQVNVKRPSSSLFEASQKEELGIEECLTKARLDTRQKQALFVTILCLDAEIPATVFEKLCKSATMKAICDEMFNNESIRLLTEIA